MERADFRSLIRRGFGYPLVNVEITDDQIDDAIYTACQKYIRFATGNAIQECYGTLMLSGGQSLYPMPDGTDSVVCVDDSGKNGGVNTLFTIDNFLYNQGAFNFFAAQTGFSMISYNIALGFLKLIRRFSQSKYTYKYHKESNLLEVFPPPDTDHTLLVNQNNSDGTVTQVAVNSPGFVLIRYYALEGSTEPGWSIENFYEKMFERDWIIDYVKALCKITLGTVRRKMENAASMVGNVSLNLDGTSFVQEGKEEKAALEEKLVNEESYVGYGISMGTIS